MVEPLPHTELLGLDLQEGVLSVTIADPATRNAMTATLMAEFEAVLGAIEGDRSVRILVVKGSSGVFCAGGDLKSTREALAYLPPVDSPDPLFTLSVEAARLFARFSACPALTVALVDGPAMGGGFGLTCCMDFVLATQRASFALSETMLGIPPSQIAPYVISRIGRQATRRLALTGHRVSSGEAVAIGLVDECFEDSASAELRLSELVKTTLRCAPYANAETKRLIAAAPWPVAANYVTDAAKAFAACLRSGEGQEGLSAFAEKRATTWTPTSL